MRFFFSGPRIFGIRPGVSFSAADFKEAPSAARARAPSGEVQGSFVYVVRGDHNLVKIGVSSNPSARLAQLRTGSPFPISFAFIAATPGDGFDIERAAHQMLARQRLNGEWFDVAPEMAIAAVNAAAARIGAPLQSVDLATADLALKLAVAGYGPDELDGMLANSAPKAAPQQNLLKGFIIFIGAVWAITMLLLLAGQFISKP
jgi:hypothetical protein